MADTVFTVRTFLTDDGYMLEWKDGHWTDGDLIFGGSEDGPVAVDGRPLLGELRVSKEQVPERVKNAVKFALDRLHTIARSLAHGRACDAKFGGDGRYEYECWFHLMDRDRYIAESLATLQEFRIRAAAKGIDPEETIKELGGVPDFSPSPATDKWIASDKAKEEAHAKA